MAQDLLARLAVLALVAMNASNQGLSMAWQMHEPAMESRAQNIQWQPLPPPPPMATQEVSGKGKGVAEGYACGFQPGKTHGVDKGNIRPTPRKGQHKGNKATGVASVERKMKLRHSSTRSSIGKESFRVPWFHRRGRQHLKITRRITENLIKTLKDKRRSDGVWLAFHRDKFLTWRQPSGPES